MPVVFNLGQFCPQGIFGNIWKHFCYHSLEKRVQLTSVSFIARNAAQPNVPSYEQTTFYLTTHQVVDTRVVITLRLL